VLNAEKNGPTLPFFKTRIRAQALIFLHAEIVMKNTEHSPVSYREIPETGACTAS